MNILWIDDQSNRYNQLKKWLKDGDSVYFAVGYDQIYHYLRESGIKWDVVILDHDMGDHMNGQEVCHIFADTLPNRVIICSTNFTGAHQMKDILANWGIDGHYKPITDWSALNPIPFH